MPKKPVEIKKPNTSKIEEIRHKRKMKRLRLGIFLVAIVCIVLVFVFTNIGNAAVVFLQDTAENIQLAFFQSGSFPVSLAVENILDTSDISGSVAVLGEKELAIYAPSGALVSNIQHGYATPKITTSNKRACLYNQGGTEMRIEGRKSSAGIKSFDRPIYFAEYSKNGLLAVITGSDTHKTELVVLSSGMEEIYKFKMFSDYPTDISFAQDNKTMAIGSVTPDKGMLKAVTYVLDINSEKEKGKIERAGSVVLHTRFIDNANLLVAYDNCVVVYSTRDFSEKAVYTYPDNIISVSGQDGQNTAFLFGDKKQVSRNTCIVLDGELNTIATFKVNEAVQKVFVTQKEVFVFDSSSVLVYNFKEQVNEKIPLDNYAVDMILAKQPIIVTNKNLQYLAQSKEN